MKSCFFIGHRDASEDLYPFLEKEIERHISEHGVEEFIVGRYGRFDGMAARAVKELKKKYPEIRLVLLMAYLKNESLPEGFDGTVYPEGLEFVPGRYAILRANQKMIDQSEFMIVFVKRRYGGAWRGLEYGRRKGKKIVNLGKL